MKVEQTRVVLLRDILLQPADVIATRSGTVVNMDANRAKELAGRGVVREATSKDGKAEITVSDTATASQTTDANPSAIASVPAAVGADQLDTKTTGTVSRGATANATASTTAGATRAPAKSTGKKK